ncbi:MAG: PKD domain-containing protein [Planctomycetaceae bacterium]|nr:PKD domain-containing protein [Planctomycetaceae bacterium]
MRSFAPQIAVAAAVFGALPSASAQLSTPAPAPHFAFEVRAQNFSGLTDFVALADGRILIAQQDGVVRAFAPDGSPEGAVLDLRDEVSAYIERGLLGMTTHPGFAADGGETSWLYLYYCAGPDKPNGEDFEPSLGRLARHRIETVNVGGAPRLVGVAGSQQVLLGERLPDGTAPTAIPLLHESHIGGGLVFGEDGTLLLSTGDGASFAEQDFGGLQPWGFDDFVSPLTGLKGPWPKDHDQGSFRAQDLRTLSGKVLRIDPETGLGLPSNPFFDGDPASRTSRVWALGLRNGFRMALVPGTGAVDPDLGQPGWMAVADVGSFLFEEVNVVKGGENLGWPCLEGFQATAAAPSYQHPPNPYAWSDCTSSPIAKSGPSLAIPRFDGSLLVPPGVHQDLAGQPLPGFTAIAIIGGAFYTGDEYPAAYQGRYVLGDFGFEWAKTVQFGTQGDTAAVTDLAEGLTSLVAVRTDPVTGNVLFGQRGLDVGQGRILELVYGANEAPLVAFDSAVAPGGDPLAIQFDASASSDPDGDDLVFTWDFGDGSPTVQGQVVTHTYAAADVYTVRLEVADGFTTAASSKPVAVALTAPIVTLLQPQQGAMFAPGDSVDLLGAGFTAAGAPLELRWSFDLFFNGQWFENVAQYTGASLSAPFLQPAGDGDDWSYRVRLEGFDGGAAVAQRTVHVFAEPRVLDVAGPAKPLAKVFDLDPPGSQGFGSGDHEVWRDRVVPQVGASASSQYATYHPLGAAASPFDWIGYEFGPGHPAGARVFGVEFTEGLHVPEGGWFQLGVSLQLRVNGVWQNAADLRADPEYPPAGAGPDFGTYRFTFAPVAAEAVRLIGRPGGSLGFLSVAELRVLASAPPGPWRDVTAEAAAPLSNTLEQVPPGPQGFGSANLERLRDGAEPLPGSTSSLAQVSTFHGSDRGSLDWFGWRFDAPTTLVGGRIREGLVWSAGATPAGGWWHDLTVETRLSADGPWVPVVGLNVTPPYRSGGPSTLDYEAYTFAFAPRVARELRVVGPGAGSLGFATASELRLFGPHAFDGGWSERPGLGLPGDILELGSSTPPVVGYPVLVEASGGFPAAPGALAIGLTPVQFPLGAVTVLYDPTGAPLVPVVLDGAGNLALPLQLPDAPALVGFGLGLQLFSVDPSVAGGLVASNALDAVFAAP